MYNLCKKLILSNAYDKEDMIKKLDIFLLKNKISQEQYTELIDLIVYL